MLKFLINAFRLNPEKQNSSTKKIFITLFLLFLFRFGSSIPLVGIDQEALKKSFFELDNKNSLFQLINMYSGGGGITLLSPFSLGIIPYINASILIDLLTALFPFLEKLQSEEGELGRKKLNFYKKIATLLFAFFQSIFVISYLKPYFYNTSFFSFLITSVELITGSFLIVWLSSLIDNKGIGSGTSLIIFTNIIVTLLSKNFFSFSNFSPQFCLELIIFFFLMLLICVSQTIRINIDVVSARQLAYLENSEKGNFRESIFEKVLGNENGLSIRLNQAGIFPIIIASNILPFFSILTQYFGDSSKFINIIVYYLLIIGFNYFYTIVFWDPEKISEQLRKASVSVVNLTPGKETVAYLENVVRSTSLLGGIFLCFILIFYEILKQTIGGSLLSQINISSLIILVGVAYEIQKNLRALYKNVIEKSKNQFI
jgi:preprotein translocase subunit SecY